MSNGGLKAEGKVSFMMKKARTHRNNLMMTMLLAAADIYLCNEQHGMASIDSYEIGEIEAKVKDD